MKSVQISLLGHPAIEFLGLVSGVNTTEGARGETLLYIVATGLMHFIKQVTSEQREDASLLTTQWPSLIMVVATGDLSTCCLIFSPAAVSG